MDMVAIERLQKRCSLEWRVVVKQRDRLHWEYFPQNVGGPGVALEVYNIMRGIDWIDGQVLFSRAGESRTRRYNFKVRGNLKET